MQPTSRKRQNLDSPMPTLLPSTSLTSWTDNGSSGPARVWAILTSMLLLAGFLTGCQSSTGGAHSATGPASLPSALSVTNTIQEGDVIQITFEGATNLNTTVKIP